MEVTTTLDTREFDASLAQYLDVTQKDMDYVCNRAALNVAIKAGQATPLADSSDIDALPQKPWWPKYVAKRISGRGVTLGGKKKKHIKGGYTRAEARKVSAKLVSNRKKRRGYMRSGWVPAIRILSVRKLQALQRSLSGTAGIRNPPGDAIPAQPGWDVVATIINKAKGANIVASAALQTAVDLAALDMRQYIAEKMQPTADQFNA
ncbi:MAG TPA: hypothetical protein VNO50_10945 [Pyrinomonadaceae bacterium]|nr:hypothetical protein [Pyrinomonadaceae bacterium]